MTEKNASKHMYRKGVDNFVDRLLPEIHAREIKGEKTDARTQGREGRKEEREGRGK